nr:hypothetical protein [Tanacetum cinerariifolium]
MHQWSGGTNIAKMARPMVQNGGVVDVRKYKLRIAVALHRHPRRVHSIVVVLETNVEDIIEIVGIVVIVGTVGIVEKIGFVKTM